jgi:hypothetical protein
MLRTFYSVPEAFLVRFFLSLSSLVMIVTMTVVSFVPFFDRIIVEGDASRPNHQVARDRDERERRTGTSLHEESASRGDVKTKDRISDK